MARPEMRLRPAGDTPWAIPGCLGGPWEAFGAHPVVALSLPVIARQASKAQGPPKIY